MNSKVSKILSLVSGLIGLIAIYFLVRIIMEGDDAVKESLDLQNSLVSPFVQFAKVILLITTVVAVVFSLWNLVRQPKLLKKTLVSLAALAVLLLISYMMASDEATTNMSGNIIKDGEAGSTSKWVSTGLWYSMILGAIGLGFFLWDFVKSLASK
jgi:glucan phosphoethanolaminetransferase (alkaline phosphatase superfamily)